MLKEHHRFFNLLFQVFDLLIITMAWILSYPLRFVFFTDIFPITKGIPAFDQYYYLTFGIVVLWYAVFRLSGVYQSRRTQSIWPEILTILRGSSLAFLVLTTGTYMITGDGFSRGVLVFFFVLSTLLLVMERVVFRAIMRGLRRRGFNNRNALVVGDNEIGAAFIERLNYHPELGLKVRGVIRLSDKEGQVSRAGAPVLGISADLSEVIKAYDIDQVILATKSYQKEDLEQILSSLVDLNVEVRVIPDLHQFITLGCTVETFEGLPLISLNQSPIIGWNRVAKRISDIIYATVALVVFSPVMFTIGLLIKVFTPGPMLYRQERMGLDGRVFGMLKFRTMRVDAEKDTGAVWATKGDQRVTFLGKLLRKTSLDELPQLWNVLKGDMSCVGPRPERPSLVEKFKHDIPGYMLRHKVKAGMTGWAQINGWRGDTSLEKRIEYDLYYISNWSLIFDFRIMLKTVVKGFISKNAY